MAKIGVIAVGKRCRKHFTAKLFASRHLKRTANFKQESIPGPLDPWIQRRRGGGCKSPKNVKKPQT